MAQESILREAERLIGGQRLQDYGTAADNFGRIAKLFNAYLDGQSVSTEDAVKLARVRNAGYHRDSYADIAGYAALAEQIHSGSG